jgi:hypothetical protein
MADITKTEDSNHPFALVDDRQPADLQFFHVPYCLGEIIVLTATMDICGHHITCHSAACIEVLLDSSKEHPNRSSTGPSSFKSHMTACAAAEEQIRISVK